MILWSAITKIVRKSAAERSVVEPSVEKKYTQSQDMSIKDIESLYLDMTLKQDFYDEAYGNDWSIGPYRHMADMINRIFKPVKHVDIGCGKGFLVEAMRSHNIDSFGIDFSAALINGASADIRKYLRVATSENVLEDILSQNYDLISYMEVFEHIPVPILDIILRAIYSKYNGKLLLTIPSHGFDPTFYKGLPVESVEWQRDMTANIPFKNIVLENGKPHCGHITLASYRWWTEFFLFHGFLRNIDLERECLSLFNEIITKHQWKPYFIQKIKSSSHLISTREPDYLGRGWYGYEALSEARWTDGHAVIYCKWEAPTFCRNIRILCLAPDVNISMESNIIVTVDRLIMDDQYRLQWMPIAGSQPQELINRGKWADVNVPLTLYQDLEKSSIIRIKLISDCFCPEKFGLSSDNRNLGVLVRSVELLA
jgi:hypothetical protein